MMKEQKARKATASAQETATDIKHKKTCYPVDVFHGEAR
jgi:hypothetical protein